MKSTFYRCNSRTSYLILLMAEIRLTTWDVWNPINNGRKTTNLNWCRISAINSMSTSWIFQTNTINLEALILWPPRNLKQKHQGTAGHLNTAERDRISSIHWLLVAAALSQVKIEWPKHVTQNWTVHACMRKCLVFCVCVCFETTSVTICFM